MSSTKAQKQYIDGVVPALRSELDLSDDFGGSFEECSAWLTPLDRQLAVAFCATYELLGATSPRSMTPADWFSRVTQLEFRVGHTDTPPLEMLKANAIMFKLPHPGAYEIVYRFYQVEFEGRDWQRHPPPERSAKPRSPKRARHNSKQKTAKLVPFATPEEREDVQNFVAECIQLPGNMIAVVQHMCKHSGGTGKEGTVAYARQVIHICGNLLSDKQKGVLNQAVDLRSAHYNHGSADNLDCLAAMLYTNLEYPFPETAVKAESLDDVLKFVAPRLQDSPESKDHLRYCCKVAWATRLLPSLPSERVRIVRRDPTDTTAIEGSDAIPPNGVTTLIAKAIGPTWLHGAVRQGCSSEEPADLLRAYLQQELKVELPHSISIQKLGEIVKPIVEKPGFPVGRVGALRLICTQGTWLDKLPRGYTDAQCLSVLANLDVPDPSETVQHVWEHITREQAPDMEEDIHNMMHAMHLLSNTEWEPNTVLFSAPSDLRDRFKSWPVETNGYRYACKEQVTSSDIVASLALPRASVGTPTCGASELGAQTSSDAAVSPDSALSGSMVRQTPRGQVAPEEVLMGTAQAGCSNEATQSAGAAISGTSGGEQQSKSDANAPWNLWSQREMLDSGNSAPATALWQSYALYAIWMSVHLSREADVKGELGSEIFLSAVVNVTVTFLGLLSVSWRNAGVQLQVTDDAGMYFPIVVHGEHGDLLKQLQLKPDRTARLSNSELYSFWFHEAERASSEADDDRAKLKFMFMAQAKGALATELMCHQGKRLHEFMALPPVLLTQQVGMCLMVWLGTCALGPNRELTVTVELQSKRDVSEMESACISADELRGCIRSIAEGMMQHQRYLGELSLHAIYKFYGKATRASTSRSKTASRTRDDSRAAGSRGATGSADGGHSGAGSLDDADSGHSGAGSPDDADGGYSGADSPDDADEGGSDDPPPPPDSQVRHRHAAASRNPRPERCPQALADLAVLAKHGWQCGFLSHVYAMHRRDDQYPKRVYALNDVTCMKVVPRGAAGGTLEGKILRHLSKYKEARAVYLFNEHTLGRHHVALQLLLCGEFPNLGFVDSLHEAVRLLIELVEAIGGWHEAGVFHRDIKPANLGSLSDSVVQILDAGSAWWCDAPEGYSLDDHHRELRARVGTDGYTAPELDGGYEFTTACDVYSLGVTLEKLVSCRRADQLKEVLDIARKMQAPNPNDRPKLDFAIQSLKAFHATIPNPYHRPKGAKLKGAKASHNGP